MSARGWVAWTRVFRGVEEEGDGRTCVVRCGASLAGEKATLVLVVRLLVRVGATGGGLMQDTAVGGPRARGMEPLMESVAVVADEASGRDAGGGATVTTPPPTATLAPGSCPIPGTQVREAVTVLRWEMSLWCRS